MAAGGGLCVSLRSPHDRRDRFRREDAMHAAEVAPEVELRDHSQAIGHLPQFAVSGRTRLRVVREADASGGGPVHSVERAEDHRQ